MSAKASPKPAQAKAPSTRTPSHRVTAPATSPGDESRDLRMVEQEGKSHARQVADLVISGDILNVIAAQRFARTELGTVDLTELAHSIRDQGKAVNAGDLLAGERLLYAQATTLNLIFTEMASRSHSNMGHNVDTMEAYMRLALKAQSQCRTTIETLAAIKNPPIVYARQMNYSNGPQQVNNGPAPAPAAPASHPRTPENQNPPNQLLEDTTHGSTELDARATTQAGRGDPELAPVGAVNRSANQ